jgi:hypothetical protein
MLDVINDLIEEYEVLISVVMMGIGLVNILVIFQLLVHLKNVLSS